MRLLALSATDIAAALPMRRCIEVMKRAFADFSAGRAQVPQRTVMPIAGADHSERVGTLLVKPGHIPGIALGAKLVSVFPGNAEIGRPVTPGLVVHLSPETGEPIAILDGTFLTAWRTGAASGAATDLLAATDARIGALFGAGTQGRTQLLAIDAVRDLEEIRVYSRTRATVDRFLAENGGRTRARLVAASSPGDAIRDADVICAATTSSSSVFEGKDIKHGSHVNAIGSFTPQMQEIDVDTVARSTVFVDSTESVAVEPGDLLAAIDAGVTRPGAWTELGAVAEGTAEGRRSDDEVTLFKSVGLAVQDLAAGAAVIERATELGLGTVIDF